MLGVLTIGNRRNGVYIPSIDGKDLLIANSFSDDSEYSLKLKTGAYNLQRFINSLDYSLDLIKLREVYTKVYRNNRFSFTNGIKEYSPYVINVTFKYSIKEFNNHGCGIKVRFGYNVSKEELVDGILIKDGRVVAVDTNACIERPIDSDILGDEIVVESGKYKIAKNDTIYTLAEIRNKLYTDGFSADGRKYVRFKRSSGSSRVGKCLFIDERLYRQMHTWEMCGLKIRKNKKIDLAALEAYISLSLSSIIDTIELYPENFLVVDDYESIFKDKVIATELGTNGWLSTSEKECEIVNSIWDGQSLLDSSMFGDYSPFGMLLLRARFFKSCCFNTNIQQFFKDNNIESVSQLNGTTLAQNISDIKIITTPSSIKYLKFGTLSQWLENIDGVFGVVKHEKPTHYFNGEMVKTHYQLINTLQMSQDDINNFLKPSFDYISLIKESPAALREYIKFKVNTEFKDEPLSSQNAIIYRLLGINDRFAQTKIYKDFRNNVIASMVKQLRKGKVLINGNYSTICGNPVEMLMFSIGKFDGNSIIPKGCIYTKRFEDNEMLLGSRSPHVTMGNILLAINKRVESVDTYFNFTNEIVVINSIGENILMRLSGSDFDSDTMLLTNNEYLIRAAKKNYNLFGVPTNMVPSIKTSRKLNSIEKADLDIKTSVNKIGEIVNLSQELNTKLWHRINSGESYEENKEMYYDIAKLDTLSMIEIDKAKRETPVDSAAEIKRIKDKYIDYYSGREIKPNFLGKIAKYKGYYNPQKKTYKHHRSAMDYLERAINAYKSPNDRGVITGITYILDEELYNIRHVKYAQVNRIIDYTRTCNNRIKNIWSNESYTGSEKYYLAQAEYSELANYIANLEISNSSMFYLLNQIEQDDNSDIKRILFKILFSVPQSNFYNLIKKSKTKIAILVRDDGGKIEIFNKKYAEKSV